MNGDDRARIAREVSDAGRCSNPIRLDSSFTNKSTGEYGERVIKVACKDRRESVCPSCSRRYGTDAWIIAATGINGGKGVPNDVAERPRIFVTMTAPSFGSVHTIHSNGNCVSTGRSGSVCGHGWPLSCGLRHKGDDVLLGRPICDECFRLRDAILWNMHASRLWSETAQQARRNLANILKVRRTELSKYAQIHYLKVAEIQRRGMIHFHSLVRLDVCHEENIEAGIVDLVRAWRDAVQKVNLRSELGDFKWGEVLDIQILGNDEAGARMLASYLAKYVTKTAGEGLELARRFRSRRQIAQLVDNQHLRRMALEVWDLALDPKCVRFNPRGHAHTLGYTGQLMTKSRRYSTTMKNLRLARSEYRSRETPAEGIASQFIYAGRGYDDPRSEVLAELLVSWEKENRLARKIVTSGVEQNFEKTPSE